MVNMFSDNLTCINNLVFLVLDICHKEEKSCYAKWY